MKNILRTPLKVVLLALTLMTAFQSSYACELNNGVGGKLFDREQKSVTTRDIANGPMFFQEIDDETYTKGYRPLKTEEMTGVYCQETYDFPSNKSAYELFERIKQNQLDAGMELGFECQGVSCGDIEGWKMFLSNHIAGNSSQQKFLMSFYGGTDFFLASNMVHINEFDGQARVVITSMFRPEARTLSLVNSHVGLSKSGDTDSFKLSELGKLFFTTSNTDDYSKEKIESISKKIKEDDLNARYLIIGYADSDGSRASNQKLSLARAESVGSNLLALSKLAPERIHIIGKGETAGGQGARRVSVYRMLLNDSETLK